MMMIVKPKHIGVKYIIVELCVCWYSKDLEIVYIAQNEQYENDQLVSDLRLSSQWQCVAVSLVHRD